MNECGDCRFYSVDPQNLKQGSCRLNPPTVFMVMVQGPGGTVQPQFAGAWPPVQSTQGCGQWQTKERIK